MGAAIGLVRWPSAPAASAASAMLGHGVGGEREDRRPRPALVASRPGSRGWRSGRPSPASACPSGPGRRRPAPRPRPPAPRFPRRSMSTPAASRISSTTCWLVGWSSAQQHPHAGRVRFQRRRRRCLGADAPPRHDGSSMTNEKLEPAPGVLSAASSPPIASSSELRDGQAKARPPKRRVIEPSACSKRANRLRLVLGRRSRCRCRMTSKRRRALSPASSRRARSVTASRRR